METRTRLTIGCALRIVSPLAPKTMRQAAYLEVVMRKLSRWMPQAPAPQVIPNSIVLLLAVAIVVACFGISEAALVTATVILLFAALSSAYDNWDKRLAASRAGESICTFARTFDRRTVDPWIIRAVYEEFYAHFGGRLSIRATDRIEEDLRMDWDDVDDLLSAAALRAGRSLDYLEPNPFYGRVRSVGDLVQLLMNQPKCE
jgi:hypothetical protein